MAKYMRLLFLTIDIIHLQAIHPLTKAAKNPDIIADKGSASAAPFAVRYSCDGAKMCLKSIRASPRIGGITIRNENCASFCFELPRSSPVAIVEPERDSPGRTATVCAMPMMKACSVEMFSRSFGL